jgi:hypothetical protein
VSSVRHGPGAAGDGPRGEGSERVEVERSGGLDHEALDAAGPSRLGPPTCAPDAHNGRGGGLATTSLVGDVRVALIGDRP